MYQNMSFNFNYVQKSYNLEGRKTPKLILEF